jgi:hypothetical protein
MDNKERTERLQVDVSFEELAAIDNFRFDGRYPTRAAAVRELMRRGLAQGDKDPPPRPNNDAT